MKLLARAYKLSTICRLSERPVASMRYGVIVAIPTSLTGEAPLNSQNSTQTHNSARTRSWYPKSRTLGALALLGALSLTACAPAPNNASTVRLLTTAFETVEPSAVPPRR